jgi:L-threonylcarbamoyladenylate synthase
VAFPTETVYGLGADALNERAVQRVFEAKGRPATNPLIVHVADAVVARRYAKDWPDVAESLAKRFWPGPLTLVLPRQAAGPFRVVNQVTAGLETVGLRSPGHPLALELLRRFDGPVAAPSANRAGHISPTTARHVREELGDKVDFVLDGGPCAVGIESTVLDLSHHRPVILRPGGVSREQIEGEIGPVEVSVAINPDRLPATSPGQHAVHYAPRTPAYRFETSPRPASHKASVWVVLSPPDCFDPAQATVAMPGKPEAYARQLYGVLRDLDSRGLMAIYIEMPPDSPEWAAVRDRLLRATKPFDTDRGDRLSP